MELTLTDLLRNQILAYLEGGLTSRQFQIYIHEVSTPFDESGAAAPAELQKVLLLMAEYTSGDWTEEEFKEHLRPIVFVQIATGSDTTYTGDTCFILSTHAGTQSVAEFV